MMTLWDLQQFNKATITGFVDDILARYRERLGELGFDLTEEVICIRATPFGGPKVYKIGDSIFSIDREMAVQILVADPEPAT